MVPPEFFEPSSTCVALSVVLIVTVMVEGGFGRQRDDLFAVRVDGDRRIGLQVIADLARLGA